MAPFAPGPGDGPVTDPVYHGRWPTIAPTTIWNCPPHASAEAQVAAIADDIAYNHHDLHDGLRAPSCSSTDDLAELPILDICFAEVDEAYPGLNYYRRRHEALRRFLRRAGRGRDRLCRCGNWPRSTRNPRRHPRGRGRPIIRFSTPLFEDLQDHPRLPVPAHVTRAPR